MMYVSWNFGLLGLQKNFSPLGKIFAFVSTMNLTGSVTPVTTKSTAIVMNSRVSARNNYHHPMFFFQSRHVLILHKDVIGLVR